MQRQPKFGPNNRGNALGALRHFPQIGTRVFGRAGTFRMAVVSCLVAWGAVVRADEPSGNMQNTTTKTIENFVPAHRMPVASVELQPEVTSTGNEVTLRQICKWPEGDAEMFAEFADLIVLRLEEGAQYATVTVEQVQSTLRDAGMNPASVNFAGAASCRVVRGDVQIDEAEALRKWVEGAPELPVLADASKQPTTSDSGHAKGDAPSVDAEPPVLGDLRAHLIYDLATGLSLKPDVLQVEFSPEDQKFLTLSDAKSFRIEPQRTGDLGNVSWLVTFSSGSESKRVRIAARARAWIEQTICTRPLGLRQTITDDDVETRRVLAERMPGDALVTRDQVVGQQAARDLKVGSVLTAKLLAPVELVRPGQLVTVLMRRGAVEIKSVARALQPGSSGQSVKVKNEATGEIFQVTLIGPQTATLSGSDPIADISN